MQAAQILVKTENGSPNVREASRVLRHAVSALLALLLALFAAVPVFADEAASSAASDDNASSSVSAASSEPTEDYSAVAAQLQAVARAEGRSMADEMLYGALRSISPAADTADDAENLSVPVSAAAAPKAVVVNAAQPDTRWSVQGILPFLAVVLSAFFGICIALRSAKRRRVPTARTRRLARSRAFHEVSLHKHVRSSF